MDRTRRWGNALSCVALLALCSACDREVSTPDAADLVFRGGATYTGLSDSAEPIAVAVRGETIAFRRQR